jgi:hypothetical protein
MTDSSQHLLDLLRGSAAATRPVASPPTANTGSSNALDMLFRNFGSPQPAPGAAAHVQGSSPSTSIASPAGASASAASLLAALNGGRPSPTSAPPPPPQQQPSQSDAERLLSLLRSSPRAQAPPQKQQDLEQQQKQQPLAKASPLPANQGRILLEQLMAGQGQGQGVQQRPGGEASQMGTEAFALATELCVVLFIARMCPAFLVSSSIRLPRASLRRPSRFRPLYVHLSPRLVRTALYFHCSCWPGIDVSPGSLTEPYVLVSRCLP